MTCSDDNTARVWDLDDGKCLSVLEVRPREDELWDEGGAFMQQLRRALCPRQAGGGRWGRAPWICATLGYSHMCETSCLHHPVHDQAC